MGGPWEVRIHGPHASESGVRAAFREIARLEGLLSRFRPDSEISRINRWDGRTSLRIHPEVFHVIRISLEHAQNSGGAFDPTLGDYRALRIHSKTPVLLSKPKGLKIDLGGIGKGYAIDRAVEILKANDVSHGRVSAGSTAFAWGGAPGRNA
ncbi:MAG TPA: FAD:protein FMN transferase, partial [Nitrospiria bacterium]|nr:FAD:protein FMN transferase [Nitrospiria bacterium]